MSGKFKILVAILCVGCSGSNSKLVNSPASGKLHVVATVGMVADLVRNVGGEFVQVEQICGSGVDPHLYKATRDDVLTLNSADLIFYSGLMLEGKLTDILVKMARKKPVLAVTEKLAEATLLEPDEFAGHYDPHVWMDVSAWRECVTVVEQVLVAADPEHANEYAANAQSYQAKLLELHQYGLQALGSIPAERRVLVTSHDAFNYMGRAYGLDVQGVQGISTESEAGLQRVNALVEMLVTKNVQAVFIESSVPRKSIDALVEGVQARGREIHIGGELFSDAMGEQGTYEGTYLGMLDHNITLVTRELGGEAPRHGWQGKLGHSMHGN